MSELLYFIPPEKHDSESLKMLLHTHPEIQFVSLMGIDISGNGTDEKIPIKLMLDDIDSFLFSGVQTDGSSVALQGIASLNDARVDLVPDCEVNWFVDYNYYYYNQSCYTKHVENEEQQLPVGTLRIPSFLVHKNNRVDSRAILKKAAANFKNKLFGLLKECPNAISSIGVDDINDIEDVLLTAGTELEFWVRTPDDNANVSKLATSQALKEQYWKRTTGVVRTVLEKCIWLLDKYGMEPEMGHKEVGGVKSRIEANGKTRYAMEQLEIDWRFNIALQASDNEILARELITDLFRNHGLEVTFAAKPIDGVAGSGEHTHVGVALKLKNGGIKNLFSLVDTSKEYMSIFGYGALMGILKNYEILNPFITSSNDAFNRLKPGFEAPVCIVTSLGHSIECPSRNRSVLVGLVRDMENPKATRFEVRSPNPQSNTYLVIASIYQAMLDGISAVVTSNKTEKELLKEISKEYGEEGFYLEKYRQYRSEMDVFEHYTQEERDELFGKPPATVWENIKNLDIYKEKLSVLGNGEVITERELQAFRNIVLSQWITELENRIIPNNMKLVRGCLKLHHQEEYTDIDLHRWEEVSELKCYLMKDSFKEKSLFTRIKEALKNQDYDLASALQIEMNNKVKILKELYSRYTDNMLDIEA